MPTGKPYGILAKPRGVTRYDTVILLNSRTLFFLSPNGIILALATSIPIPASIKWEPMIYMPAAAGHTLLHDLWSGIAQFVSRGDCPSRQSAHGAPYVIGGPGPVGGTKRAANHNPYWETITRKDLVCPQGELPPDSTKNFYQASADAWDGVIHFGFALREDRGLYSIIPCCPLTAARTLPTGMSVTMARNESMTLCFVRFGLSCPTTEFDCEGFTFGLTFGPPAGLSLP